MGQKQKQDESENGNIEGTGKTVTEDAETYASMGVN